ncbi:hypothetical protein BU15DRAFT_63411 [Melanogaster broomeanus]|nr:hypothetical protein BU15DRAFT_63411 [Melanogaster broomeanus]
MRWMVVRGCERVDEDLVGVTRNVPAACLAWRIPEAERAMPPGAQPWIRVRAKVTGFSFILPELLDLRYLFRRQDLQQRGIVILWSFPRDEGASLDITAAVDDGGGQDAVGVTAEHGSDGCGIGDAIEEGASVATSTLPG